MKHYKPTLIQHRNNFRKKPMIAQALWLLPIFGLLKNLIDTLIIGKDIVSERKFGIKEKLFKTLSALSSLCFWRVILYYSTIDNFNIYLLISLTTLLQAWNRWFYAIGVYFSGELQQILFNHRSTLQYHTNKLLTTAKMSTKKIIHTTKKGAQDIWNTIIAIQSSKYKK